MSPRIALRRWFFRRQGAESGTLELDRPRIYILPTKAGVFFVAVLLVMYVGAINYNLGLGHALVYLLSGLGMIGMLHTFRNLIGLKLRAGRASPVFAGERASFEILVENRRDERRPGICLQKFDINATSSEEKPQRADLASKSTSVFNVSELTAHRGTQQLGRLVVSTRYPLGLFRAWSYPWPMARCLVYPSPIFVPLPPPRSSDLAAAGQSIQTEGLEDFAGFRRHQAGDSPRHIAWKIYARDTANSPLLVKEFSGSGVAQHWFDWEQTPLAEGTETRLSIFCGWVLQAQRGDLAFGMSLPGMKLSPGRGEQHIAQALEALALFGAER